MLSNGMIERPLEQISSADLDALVTLSRAEGRRLDYKLTFPGTSDKAVKDFLSDVSSFANTDGGDIVLGIREDGNGAAAEVVGIPATTLDTDILGIEDQVRNCIDPRLPGFRVHTVMLECGEAVLVLRVTASGLAPHRVTYKGSSRFYARNSRGKFEMNTGELRLAFAATDEMPRKIRDLHNRAIAATTGADMPCSLANEPAVILTVAPMSILREARDIPISRALAVLPARTSGASEMVLGLDGMVVHSPLDGDAKAVRTWSINHRRGYVDFAWTIGRTENGIKKIWRKYFDQELLGAVHSAVARLRSYGIEAPWVAMVTLQDIRDCRVVTGDSYMTRAAWQDHAYLGEIIDDSLSDASLQPFIDRFWRLFGEDYAPHVGS